jgi:hypothetical protein
MRSKCVFNLNRIRTLLCWSQRQQLFAQIPND